MSSEIDALMGLGMQPDPRQLAEMLRGNAYAGDVMAGSTIKEVARGGMNDANVAREGAAQAGVLNQRREASKLSRTMANRKGDAPKAMALYYNINDPEDKRMLYQEGSSLMDGDTQSAVERPSNWRKVQDKGSEKRTGDPVMMRHKDTGETARLSFNPYTTETSKVGGKKEVVDMADYQNVLPSFESKQVGEAVDDIAAYKVLTDLEGTLDEVKIGTDEGDVPMERRIRMWAGKTFPTIAEEVLGDDAYEMLGWQKKRERWYAMLERHKLFGSALSEGERKLWVDGNVNADSTTGQVMADMRELVQMSRDKLTGKIEGYGGIYNRDDVSRNYIKPMEAIDNTVSARREARANLPAISSEAAAGLKARGWAGSAIRAKFRVE